MKPTKFIAVTALYTALLLAVQFALSGVGGVELVTVFFLSFCFSFGIGAGVTVAVCFSLLRCFIFGFYPTVIVLYLVYYTLFAVFFGFIGKCFNRRLTLKAFLCVVITSVIFTAFFTLLDDVITPLMYGFGANAAKTYFYSSLPFMLSQCICTAISVSVLTFPLCRAFNIETYIKNRRKRL